MYISLLILSVLGYLLFVWAKPKPIDWSEGYSGLDKQPYGCFILRDLLPDLFPNKLLQYSEEPIIMTNKDSIAYQNAIFINQSFSPDSIETARLTKQVTSGKTLFIATRTMDGELADTLHLSINSRKTFLPVQSLAQTEKDSILFNFTNNEINNKEPWYYYKANSSFYFSSYDTLRTTVLGINSNGDANYIKMEQGNGAFFIHSVPFAFTNFYMRNAENANYAFRALSYLPVAPTVWDEYYKVGRAVNTSPLRYIVSQYYLRWAWITALVSLLLFFIFKAKRRQRIIPNIEHPRNTTLDFVTTIGRLYHKNNNHKDIASKRISYLMEYIREKLNLDARKWDDAFLDRVSQKSGANIRTVTILFDHILSIRDQSSITSDELWQLNNQIENFYNQSLR